MDTNVTDPGRKPDGTTPPAGGASVVDVVGLDVVAVEESDVVVAETLVEGGRELVELQDAVTRATQTRDGPAAHRTRRRLWMPVDPRLLTLRTRSIRIPLSDGGWARRVPCP